MAVSGQHPHSWDRLNKELQKALAVENPVMLFHTPAQALLESLLYLQLTFSHKKKILSALGPGGHGVRAQMELARLGVRFKKESGEDPASEKKSLLATLWDGDNALTGEKYSTPEFLNTFGGDDVYTISLFHHQWPQHLGAVDEKEIRLLRLNENYTVALLGSKVSWKGFVSPTLHWGCADEVALQQCLKEPPREDKEKVIAFEKGLCAHPDFSQSWRPWFQEGSDQRYFDRASFLIKGHDGGAFVDLFHEKFQIPKRPLGASGVLESLSFSRWQNSFWLEQSKDWGRSPENLKASVFVPLELIEKESDLLDKMGTVFRELKKLSVFQAQ